MKKGNIRKAQILKVAESLFYEKGYDATSIDDILQALGLSKGGFYHHFESKQALLFTICEEKVGSTAKAIRQAVDACPGSYADKINAMYDKNGLWQNDRLDFLGLLIRVGYRGGNLALREELKRRLMEQCLPIINEIVEGGAKSGEFLTPYPLGAGTLVLQLGASLTDSIAFMLSGNEPPSTAKILEYLELYRYAIEQVLGAPYGSISLYQMRYMADLCMQIYSRHLKNAGGTDQA